MVSPRPLKLRARDLEDMEVLAAMLQDAVVRAAEMTYLRREKRFVMVVSRFRWEQKEATTPGEMDSEYADDDQAEEEASEAGVLQDARFEDAGVRPLNERVNAGVCFDRVRNVRTQKLDLRDKDQVLSLLTVETRPNALTLVFSGGGLVRLELSGIACYLEDLGEPWPTPWRPSHGADAGTSSGSEGADAGG